MTVSTRQPEFGTVEYELLSELQKELCRSYVHLARRGQYKSDSMANSAHEDEGTTRDTTFNDRYLAGVLATIEDDALLSALGRMRRFLVIAKNKKLIPSETGKRFEALAAPLKEIRDMREHYDAYLQGKGEFQSNFVSTHTFAEGQKLSSNAKWSVQVGSEETLGCRLKIIDIGKAIGQLREELEAGEIWILPWKAIDLVRRCSAM